MLGGGGLLARGHLCEPRALLLGYKVFLKRRCFKAGLLEGSSDTLHLGNLGNLLEALHLLGLLLHGGALLRVGEADGGPALLLTIRS